VANWSQLDSAPGLVPGAAHQRWFHPDGGRAFDPASVTDPASLAAVTFALVATAVVYLLWRRSGQRSLIPGPETLADHERQAVLLGVVPLVLALHVAIPLLVSGLQLQLFVPNLSFAAPGPVRLRSALGALVALGEIAVGLALVYGLLTRLAALLLALLWLVGAAVFGPFLLVEQALFLGMAAFFLVTGRAAFSVDAALGWPLGGPLVRLAPYAIPALRVSAGVGLAAVALGEKVWNVSYGESFLAAYPLNVLAAVGLPVSDRAFILLAGVVELTAGLLLVSGAFVREAILVLWLPFNLTLAIFGWRELVGHLPIYGAMAVLLVWGAGDPRLPAALRRGLVQRPTLGPPDPAALDK
jgi:uncharacterized membrane protein YphA (DoxX/SURF4 family)